MNRDLRFWSVAVVGLFLLLMWPQGGYSQPLFTDVATEMGLNAAGTCGYLFWYDYDDDGDLDVLQGRRFWSDTELYRNDGTIFTRVPNIGLPVAWDASGSIPMDFDHDGDQDLFFPCYHTSSLMLVNEGGHFVDRTATLGLPEINGSRDFHWVDFDHDGFMDILYGHYTEGFMLFRNVNGAQFEDITSQTGLPLLPSVHSTAEGDIDLDGDIDLFMTCIDEPERMFLNTGNGVFEDITVSAGLSGMVATAGCVFVDINHDKLPDLLTQGGDKHTIYFNNGNRTFTEARVHGTATDFTPSWPYGAVYAVADFDMDNDYDFYSVRPGGCGGALATNQFFICDSVNGLDIYFHDIAPQIGFDVLEDGAPTVADFDDDGDLDLFVGLQGQPNHLYRNNTNSPDRLNVAVMGPNGEKDRWLTRVEVYPHGSNVAIGSTELTTANVGRNGWSNYFVLDDDASYDVRIYFADGTVMTPDDYPNLANVVPSQINHRLTVYEGQAMAIDKPEVTVPLAFNLEPLYPNPFNATATLRYTLPTAGNATLKVYNVAGQLTATLAAGMHSAGEHSVQWDASSLSTGVYFVRLEGADGMVTRKAMLLK